MEKWPVMTFSTGPADFTSRTLRDMARPITHEYDPVFLQLYDRTVRLLQHVFRTQYDTVIMGGEAVLALEAAAASLLSPGDKVLNLVSGVYGKWYEQYIKKYGGQVVELAVPYNEAIDPSDVERVLKANPDIKFLSVVHTETLSGTVNPVREIGAIAQRFGVLTIVDAVSGLGGEVMSPEEWGMDVTIAGPQKCLGGPSGLSLIAVSPRAWKAMESRVPPLRGSYLSILDWKSAWIEQRRFPYTPPISDVYALESALSQVAEIGTERYARRHAQIAAACRAGAKAMGLELWPAREEIASNAITAVLLPPGVEAQSVCAHMRRRYGVTASGGTRELDSRLLHLSHMGKTAHPAYLAAQLAILEKTLADLGCRIELGSGVAAAMEALQDWKE